MAIDTQEKRSSIQYLTTPNNAKDVEWRREIVGLYPFTLADGGGGGETDAPHLIPTRMTMGMSMGM